jgi:hypothetical protein
MGTTAPPDRLVLRFGGRLVEQLGAQLYPRVTASVAELVSNAWDADARNCWIKIPFDEEWKRNALIEVLDDGHGMTREQAADKYLVVGRNRRVEDKRDTSEGGRPLHGRKGIGKLAAFGTAGYLECVTVRDGELTAFGIDYDKLRTYSPKDDYPVEDALDAGQLLDPRTGEVLAHGTRVRLSALRAKRKTGEDSFRRSMERRFALDATAMTVWINGEALKRYNIPVHIRFPDDGTPPRAGIVITDDRWASEAIPYPLPDEPDATRPVRWWIGFTKTPIAEEDVRGVSVLARGKLAQRPFLFERGLGTTGQLGQEYLVGEVAADWLDHGRQADEDLIQSNRDQLQLDNAELEPFMKWGRELVGWALAQRNRVRRDQNVGPEALGPKVEAVLHTAPSKSRERLRTLAGRIAEITQADEDALAGALQAVVAATDTSIVERAAADLVLEGDPDDADTWQLLQQAAEAVAPSARALYNARREALGSFLVAIAEPPASGLHRALPESPWMVSPLLANVARDAVRVDNDVAVVRFEAVPPIFDGLTVACWAVGLDPPAAGLDGIDVDLQIASSWAEVGPGMLTWQRILESSALAHDRMIGLLEELL